MKNWLNTRMYVSLGLCGVTLSVLLAAGFLGLVPDRIASLRASRASLAEVVAVSSTAFITAGNVGALEAMLKLVVERNPDLRSVVVRRDDGTRVVHLGDASLHASASESAYSVERQVKVPILAAEKRWGMLELGFQPLDAGGVLGFLQHAWVQLFGAVFFASFVAYYAYLGRVLRQLDPSQAVPERVRHALDTLAEGLLVVDRRQYIVLANSAFAHVVGIASEQLVGRHVGSLPWQDDQGKPLDHKAHPWKRVLARGEHLNQVILGLCDSSGSVRAFIANCAPITGGSRPNGVLISLDDVTQLEEKKVELARAKDEAEAANRAKSAFLANMSHEIRTPMNAILGFTELLRRGHGVGEPKAQKHLGTIHSSGRHLLELINDILDLSKVESGQLEVDLSVCEPHTLVAQVIEILSVRAREKNVSLVFDPIGLLPAGIRCDAARLRQIVTNLVGNAIKFTERGEVRVSMQLIDDAETPRLQVTVKDSGIGIDSDKLESIFEPFVQADVSVSRRFGGTGLGLAISRRFARALGGDIQASSVPGEGSVFVVTLPTGPLNGVRRLAAEEIGRVVQSAHEVAATAQWRFRDRRVLVVDDGPENRELVRLVLEECGIVVDEAEDGVVGVEKVLNGHYDAVLMDIQMPRLDGLAACRLLHDRGSRSPVIALTAHAMKGFEDDMRRAGFDRWLTKPIDLDAMLTMLGGLLGGERAETTASAMLAEDVWTKPAAAASPIVSRYVNKPRLHAAVRKFVERLPAQITVMQAALDARDFDALARLAHGIKGAGGTVGFDEFTEPAIELERAASVADAEAACVALDLIGSVAGRVVVPESTPVADAA